MIADIQVLMNHAFTLQLQMVFGTVCMEFWEPV